MKNSPYSYILKIEDRVITLKIGADKKPSFILYFLLFFGATIFLVPFIIFLLFLADDTFRFGFGFLFSCSIAWAVGYYLIKMFLWNKYGEEHYIVKDGVFESYNDYRYYEANRKKTPFGKLDVDVVSDTESINDLPNMNSIKGNYLIRFISAKTTIAQSMREIPVEVIIKMRDAVKTAEILLP